VSLLTQFGDKHTYYGTTKQEGNLVV